MSWNDPCGYCGVSRQDCECNNRNNHKKLPALSEQDLGDIKKLGFPMWSRYRAIHPDGELIINGGRCFAVVQKPIEHVVFKCIIDADKLKDILSSDREKTFTNVTLGEPYVTK